MTFTKTKSFLIFRKTGIFSILEKRNYDELERSGEAI